MATPERLLGGKDGNLEIQSKEGGGLLLQHPFSSLPSSPALPEQYHFSVQGGGGGGEGNESAPGKLCFIIIFVSSRAGSLLDHGVFPRL